MKILFLTQWFFPEPFFKGLHFCKALQNAGNDVEVITGFPNYPNGSVYPGYRIKRYQNEILDGVQVHRFPLYPSHDRSGIKRILNYLSFSASSLAFGWKPIQRPDVVYVYNLITLAWTAVFLRWRYGCKIVYDVQDLWPESVASSGMLRQPILLGLLKWWSNWAYKTADYLVVQSPGFKKNLVDRGVSEDKIEIIYNWAPSPASSSEAGDVLLEAANKEEGFKVVFAGTMGVMQGLDTVLETAKICQEKCSKIQFFLVGDGVEKDRLLENSREFELNNLFFIPRQGAEKMGALFAEADLLLVHLKNHPLFKITIPSKTQAYMASGKPILMSVDGDAAELIDKAECGAVCPSEDPVAMASEILKLRDLGPEALKEKGKRGFNFYHKNLAFEKGVESFERIFRQMEVIPTKKSVLKAVLDRTCAAVGLVLLSPVFLILWLVIRFNLGRPVLFRQLRPGQGGEPFTLYKFRTMTDGRDENNTLLPDKDRLTRLGQFLRSSSLDELPALVNVLRGEMSLVGPRPLLMEYLELYSHEQARRHEVQPGITGWAQINGRNSISWEDKFKLDVWYVDNRSFKLDLVILLKTLTQVVRRRGISQEGHVTSDKFTGNPTGGDK